MMRLSFSSMGAYERSRRITVKRAAHCLLSARPVATCGTGRFAASARFAASLRQTIRHVNDNSASGTRVNIESRWVCSVRCYKNRGRRRGDGTGVASVFVSTPRGWMEEGFGRARRCTLATRTAWVNALALGILCALAQRTLAQGAIEGQVRYYSNNAAVPGVQVDFNGIGVSSTTTDANGEYAFTDPGTGSCSIQPEKTGGLNGAISTLDATWILQAVVGARPFNSTQNLACDVTGDGTLSALDAARILQLIA